MIKALPRAELRGYRQTNIPTFRDPHLSSHFFMLSLSPTQHRRQTLVLWTGMYWDLTQVLTSERHTLSIRQLDVIPRTFFFFSHRRRNPLLP